MERDAEAVLTWTCEACGWSVDVPMPGYAGDGYRHYIGGNSMSGCGPLVARRTPGFVRANPGASSDEVAALVGEARR